MTRKEFEAITFLLANGWKGGLSADQEEAYYTLIGHCDKDDVVGALRSLLRGGSPFVPAAAEIAQAIEGMRLPIGSFDEVWPVIYQAMRSFNPLDGGSVDRVLERVAGSAGETAAGWLSVFGVARLALEPVDDPAFGGAVLKRLRDSWVEMTLRPEQRDRLARQLGEVRRGEFGRVDAVGLLAVSSSVEFGAVVDG